MPTTTYQADLERAAGLLAEWVRIRTSGDGWAWLDARRREIAHGAPDWKFFTAFSAAPRYVGKDDLALPPDALAKAGDVRPGWRPVHWSVDQAARTLLVFALPHGAPDAYVGRLDKVFSTADVGEAVALYQGLPLLPYPVRLRPRAAEGVRTNMTSVFRAVAHHNPYPADYFDDGAWNQMVLKALFVGVPLHPIVGLDRRANAPLARMLVDYAHERWAAGRPVAPELWRPVGPFAKDAAVADLARVLGEGAPAEQEAAALALHASPAPTARDALATDPALRQRLEAGTLTWETFTREHIHPRASE